MSADTLTSNAPRRLRVGVRPPVGNYQRVRLVDHSPTAAYMDESIHEYVRRDLVVPLDALAAVDAAQAFLDRADLERLRDWATAQLSRIERDNDER